MKKLIGIALAAFLVIFAVTGCAEKAETPSTETSPAPAGQAPEGMSGAITVISREEGSGTRGAFTELMGILQKDANGEEVDRTVETAEIASSTNMVMTTVQSNEKAIGYISLGSLNDTVKALTVDGAAATPDNIIAGAYPIARPFNLASMNGEFTEAAQDFIHFILSDEGQKVAVDNGYISTGSSGAYTGGGMTGSIVCAGSTSVAPLMEKVAEAYKALNPGVDIEIQATGSSAGMTAAIDGVCDIGMASRGLKDSETEKGLVPIVMAMDGIAVIVNSDSPIDNLTSEQITAVFTGEITDWAQIS